MLNITGKDEEQSINTLLLQDIDKIFESRNDKPIASIDLVERLNSIEESPWSEFNRGKELTTRKLAKLLRNCGIRPETVRIGDKTKKGYKIEYFHDAFDRYLPPPSEPK